MDTTKTEQQLSDAPKATSDQLDRARRLAVGRNAHLASTPDRLEALALGMPLTRRERQKMRREDQEAGQRQRITGPRRVRSQPPIARPEAVAHFLATVPAARAAKTPSELAYVLGAGVGYSSLEAVEHAGNRAMRYLRKLGSAPSRIPTHIRNAAVLSSAIVQAIATRFPDQVSDETRAASEAMTSGAAFA